MNLRPFTPELMYHCAHTPYCRDCAFRVGCEKRYSFYQISEMEFEVWLQTTELQMNASFNPTNSALKKEEIFIASNKFRRKVRDEKMMHPHFSFM